jgi:hypothetical protein
LLEFAPDLVNDYLIENRGLFEVHDQHFASVFEIDVRVLKRFGHAVDLSLLKVSLENQSQASILERFESTAVARQLQLEHAKKMGRPNRGGARPESRSKLRRRVAFRIAAGGNRWLCTYNLFEKRRRMSQFR